MALAGEEQPEARRAGAIWQFDKTKDRSISEGGMVGGTLGAAAPQRQPVTTLPNRSSSVDVAANERLTIVPGIPGAPDTCQLAPELCQLHGDACQLDDRFPVAGLTPAHRRASMDAPRLDLTVMLPDSPMPSPLWARLLPAGRTTSLDVPKRKENLVMLQWRALAYSDRQKPKRRAKPVDQDKKLKEWDQWNGSGSSSSSKPGLKSHLHCTDGGEDEDHSKQSVIDQWKALAAQGSQPRREDQGSLGLANGGDRLPITRTRSLKESEQVDLVGRDTTRASPQGCLERKLSVGHGGLSRFYEPGWSLGLGENSGCTV